MIYGYLYRSFMRLAHRFNWHYAPEIGPFEDGSTQLWCKWCGLRETKPPRNPSWSLRDFCKQTETAKEDSPCPKPNAP